MKQFKRIFGIKHISASAAAALLLALAFAIMALPGCGNRPAQTAETAKTAELTAAPAETPEPTAAPAETEATTEGEEASPEPTEFIPGYIASEEVRLNTFLTSIVQQNIENTNIDLDEDAELVRFAFGYLGWNEKGSVQEQEADGAECRILTLEQVNGVLNMLFGRTVEPEEGDYSIPDEEFHCIYREGSFINSAPFHEEEFSFPLRFALVERINEEDHTLHFRLYRINPYVWGVGEAERHVPIMPLLSIREAEGGNEETQNWIKTIAEGDAVLRDLGDELQLVELTTTLKP